MLRNTLLVTCLLSCALTRQDDALAQAPAGQLQSLPANEPAALVPPAPFALAQNQRPSLAERLQAIRGTDGTGERTSSRRTAANRAPQTESVSTAPATLEPTPDTVLQDATSRTAAPDLPSVLVRREAAHTTPAPVTDASDLATIAADRVQSPEPSAVAGQSTLSPRGESQWQPADASAFDVRTARVPVATSATTTVDSARLLLSEQGPSLRVETIGPKAISVGKAATYRVRLVNQGNVAGQQVEVTASVGTSVEILAAESRLGTIDHQTDAAGARRVKWLLDAVPASSQQELTLQLKVTSNEPLDLKVDWTHRPASLVAHVTVQQPQLTVNVDGPSEMRFGETKVFRVRLSNPGNGPAEDVAVNISATGASSQPQQIGTLAAGESRMLELELTAAEAGTMRILALARGDGDLEAKSDLEVQVRRAELVVQIAAPGLVYAGTTASYKIRVANRGDAVAEGVIMQLELPTGATNGIGVDKKAITLDQPRWRIGDLTPGAERTYSMQCDLQVSGQNQLVARLQGVDNSHASGSAVTTVEAIADLKLVVNDPQGPIPVGQDVTYEIQVFNRGSKEATGISIVAQFSEGIEPTNATGHRADIVPGQVVFEPIEKIPAGGTITLKITARAGQGGNLRFRTELNCGNPETKLVAEESTRFYGTADVRSASMPEVEATPANR